jgi:hypothetical protein
MGQAKNGLECSGLAGTVGPDQANDASRFNVKINIVQG